MSKGLFTFKYDDSYIVYRITDPNGKNVRAGGDKDFVINLVKQLNDDIVREPAGDDMSWVTIPIIKEVRLLGQTDLQVQWCNGRIQIVAMEVTK